MDQDKLVRQIVERTRDGGIVFVVGSGISSVAGLPTAAELLKATARRYLPRDHLKVKRVLNLIQPEVFYEELALFLGQDAFRAFIPLTTEDAEPTPAHYLLVNLAKRSSLPIVTTNFDCLFEKASRGLGIEPVATGPSGPFEIHEGKVSIWKVHGSIEPGKPESVRSLGATMTQITAPNQKLLKSLRANVSGRDICLVAYSGRDIDLFPNLRQVVPQGQIYWIDTEPDNVSARANRARAGLVEGTLVEVMEAIWPEILEGLPANPLSGTSPDPSSRDRSMDLLRKAVDSGPPLSEDAKELFLAVCLYRIGDATTAATCLAEKESEHLYHTDWVHRAQSRIRLAQVSDAVSDYCAAERHSRHAVRLARRMAKSDRTLLSTALLIHGLHGLAMARKMQLGPVFPFRIPRIIFRVNRSRAMVVLIQYIYVSIRMWLLLRRLGAKAKTSSDQRLNQWSRRARNRYYDHTLILVALLEGFIGRARPARRVLYSWLMGIHNRAQVDGDWRIVPHVLKQIQRLSGGNEADLSFAQHAYELTGDPLNHALLARNAGERLLKEGKLPEARAKFLEAFESATKCGSKATGLKALVGLYVCGEGVKWEDAKSVFDGLTGEGYERFAEVFAPIVRQASQYETGSSSSAT